MYSVATDGTTDVVCVTGMSLFVVWTVVMKEEVDMVVSAVCVFASVP